MSGAGRRRAEPANDSNCIEFRHAWEHAFFRYPSVILNSQVVCNRLLPVMRGEGCQISVTFAHHKISRRTFYTCSVQHTVSHLLLGSPYSPSSRGEVRPKTFPVSLWYREVAVIDVIVPAAISVWVYGSCGDTMMVYTAGGSIVQSKFSKP
jgi:hypothetical protein